MLKKLWVNIKLFFYYLTSGMVAADNVIRGNNEDNPSPESGVEQEQEVQNVYKDMLKGEVTQEVKEVRHEMYFSERESHKYNYSGNGTATKNNVFNSDVKSLISEDGYVPFLVQQNDEIPKSLTECGVYIDNGNVVFDEKEIAEAVKNKPKSEKEYRLKFSWNFTPRFNLEKYVNNFVALVNDETGDIIVNLYVTKYRKQFDKTWTLFESELKKINDGNTRSDVLDFSGISFITYKSIREDYYVYYNFTNFSFVKISEKDGDYVLTFKATLAEKNDLINEFYDEKTAQKCESHEQRKNSTITFEDAMVKPDEEKIAKTKEASELIQEKKRG